MGRPLAEGWGARLGGADDRAPGGLEPRERGEVGPKAGRGGGGGGHGGNRHGGTLRGKQGNRPDPPTHRASRRKPSPSSGNPSPDELQSI